MQRPQQQNRRMWPGLRGAAALSLDTDSGVSEAEKQPQQTTRPGGVGGSWRQWGSSSPGGIQLPLWCLVAAEVYPGPVAWCSAWQQEDNR